MWAFDCVSLCVFGVSDLEGRIWIWACLPFGEVLDSFLGVRMAASFPILLTATQVNTTQSLLALFFPLLLYLGFSIGSHAYK